MLPTSHGSVRLIRLFGIDVFLHWSWFLVAGIQFYHVMREQSPDEQLFHNRLWHVALYLTLFAIVTMHEFGHALACRSVGGSVQRIILWPLGGVAFVQPPQRPGPVLWSIAAGPLVNILLVPVTVVFAIAGRTLDPAIWWDLTRYLNMVAVVNFVLLCFNLLPIYPLDGGQIVQALLWFVMGRSRSLRVTAIVGMVVAAPVAVVTLLSGMPLLFLLALFIGWQAFNGYRVALYLAAEEAAQRVQEQRWAEFYGRWDQPPQ